MAVPGAPSPDRPSPAATVRVEGPGDGDAVAAVVEAAFRSPAHARLVDDLRASTAHVPELALVAERDGRVVGHVMITMATLVDGDRRRPIANLSPLAVAPGHQRAGVGAALVRAVVARARAEGQPAVVLEGDPRYYGRFGFEPAAPLGLRLPLPGWAPPEAAQVLRLPGWDPNLRGVVTYPAPFAALTDG